MPTEDDVRASRALDIDAPANTLLLAPWSDPREDDHCRECLTPVALETENVLFVTLNQSPDGRLAFWREHVGDDFPGNLSIISVGESTRSGDSALSPSTKLDYGSVSIETIDSPGDLTQLGVSITDTLSAWSGGDPPLICFQSVSTLLQYVDRSAAFRFFHTLTMAVRNADGIAHFHMDPGAHDDQVVQVMAQVFDSIVDVRELETSTPARGETLDGDDVHRTLVGDDESPSNAIIRAVAAVKNADPAEMDATLYDYVDPDALEQVVRPSDHPGDGGIEVHFTFDGYRVVATGTEVSVRTR